MFYCWLNIPFRFLIVSLLAGMMNFVACHNRQPPPPPGNDFLQQNQLPPEAHDIQQAEGTMMGYKANHDGDIDKLIVQTSNGILLFRFPPHTAKQVMSMAVKNAALHVWFDDRKKPMEHVNDGRCYELVSLDVNNNNSPLVIHNIPPPKPSTGSDIMVVGSAIQWQQDEDGKNMRFILSGKLVALPLRAAENLTALLKNAHSIVVKGVARNAADGFVNSSGLLLVKPRSITIDSINYIIP